MTQNIKEMQRVLKPKKWMAWGSDWLGAALLKVALFCTVRLRKAHPKIWVKLVENIKENEYLRPSPITIVQRAEENANRLEIGQQSESIRDINRYNLIPKRIPKWADEIATFLANQLSDHTRRAYEGDLKQFFRFVESRINLEDIQNLRADHIVLFRKVLEEGRLNGKIYSKTTINRKLAVVKSFLKWLQSQRLLGENPAEHVKSFPQNQESALKGLSDAETRKILELPRLSSRSGSLHRAILSCLFYLGLRKGELIRLQMGDLDEERGVPVLKVRGKGHRIRILPLTPAVQQALKHYFHACSRDVSNKEAPLFLPTKNPRFGIFDRPMNPHAITYIVQRYAKRAGILKRISPHSCRATCISNALDRRATQRSVQVLAGWSTPLMIQRYDKRREELKNSAAYLVNYEENEPRQSGEAQL